MNWGLFAKIGGVAIGIAPKVYRIFKPKKKKEINRLETIAEVAEHLITRKGELPVKDLFYSKKMVYFLATLLVVGAGSFTSIEPELLEKIIYFGMMAIGGQSLADGWSKGKTSASVKE